MKKLFAVMLATVSTIALAHDNWTSTSGQVWKSGTGLCWRNASWTPASASADCDGATKVAAVAAITPVVKKETETPVTVKVSYQTDTFFDFDKSVIKPAGKQALDKLVEKINNIKLEVIVIVGHTDSIGTEAYNMKLGERRATAVKSYLTSKGLDNARIYTESKGESRPVADNATKEGRAKNRRVEIEVVGASK